MFKFTIFILKKLINKKSCTKIGDPNGSYYFLKLDLIKSNSKIITLGIGNEISFEKELIAKKNCKIVALDPSPTAINFFKTKFNAKKNIKFLKIGVSSNNKFNYFKKPDNQLEGSFKKGNKFDFDIRFKTRNLSTLIAQLNFNNIDLLKMDIEGFEYEILDEILKTKIKINQLIVEFHTNRNLLNKNNKTIFSVLKYLVLLRLKGYKLIYFNKSDFLFLNSN